VDILTSSEGGGGGGVVSVDMEGGMGNWLGEFLLLVAYLELAIFKNALGMCFF
jgi:hypothetical protein